MTQKLTDDFLRAIPKTDLHVHIDGSLRPSTLIELAKERNVELPSYTGDGLRELVFKEHYNNLAEYLHGFKYTCAVLQDPEALERVSYELAVDSFSEGVRYIEPRFAPQLHVSRELQMPAILMAVDRGLKRACDEFNATEPVQSGREPRFLYGIIVCAMRFCSGSFSRYYDSLFRAHSYSPERHVIAMASMELARAAVQIRDNNGVPVVGFDLAGREDGYPAHDHRKAYDFAHQNFMHKTVHAGEAYGPESIFEAITLLHADRIGHGLFLFHVDKLESPRITDPERYVKALADYVADRRVTLEICLTSNLQTNPAIPELTNHPVRKMLDAKLSTTFCTDNRLVSSTSVSRELRLAIDHVGLTQEQLRHCIIYGFKRSFMPLKYTEKRAYVRQIIDFYEAMERCSGLEPATGSTSYAD
ncbi:adenosine deaminase family protein [Candidatus Sumerlaeota bacterium]|nr:adenosine deaminase family protein [Candidatus Sumerlaeota bacterium]